MNDNVKVKVPEPAIQRAAELLRERTGGSPPLCEQKIRDLVALLECLDQALGEEPGA